MMDADFEDDGASFRVRRMREVQAVMRPKTNWIWRGPLLLISVAAAFLAGMILVTIAVALFDALFQ